MVFASSSSSHNHRFLSALSVQCAVCVGSFLKSSLTSSKSPLRLLGVLLAVLAAMTPVPVAMAQIVINTKIVGAQSAPTDGQLDAALINASLPPAQNVSSQTSQDIISQACPVGTFAEGNASSCTPCSNGTASNVNASTTHLSCQKCVAGTWSGQGAPTCTQCGADTFEPNPGAPAPSSCRACPPNSASGTGTNSLLGCACNNGTFYNADLIEPLDPVAVVAPSWASLQLDSIVLDIAHLSC